LNFKPLNIIIMKNTKPFTNFISRVRAFVPSAFCFLLSASCLLPLRTFAQFSGGTGTETNPYIINNVEQLAKLATYVNAGNTNYNDKCYKLGNDIDLAAYQSGAGWTPIGIEYDFRGSFDGNGKKITALYINNPNLECTGLFGYAYRATLTNVTVENVNINGGGNVDLFTANSSVGAIVGYAYHCNITNCYSSGEICGKESVGGIVGFFTGQISHCHSTCKITGIEDHWLSVGGVVGKLYNSYATHCDAPGALNIFGEVADQSVMVEN
jgi:hypothetical protein